MRILQLIFGTFLLAGPASAQTWHHIHLAAPDVPTAQAWYVEHLDGEGRGARAVGFGSTNVNIWERTDFEGSEGGALDHFGLSVPDLSAKLAEFKAIGIDPIAGVQTAGDVTYAHIRDPWGTKIELLQDPHRQGFHHVHLYVPSPDSTQAWFVRMFGGEPSMFLGRINAVDYGDTWVFASSPPDGKLREPSVDRSFDHLGWLVDDLDAFAAEIRAKGAEFSEEPHAINERVRISYVTGPGGVNVEVLSVDNP